MREGINRQPTVSCEDCLHAKVSVAEVNCKHWLHTGLTMSRRFPYDGPMGHVTGQESTKYCVDFRKNTVKMSENNSLPKFLVRSKYGVLLVEDFFLSTDGELFKKLRDGNLEKLKSSEYIVQRATGFYDSDKNLIYENDLVMVNNKLHGIIFRKDGFYCSGTSYGLDSCYFLGGAPKKIGNIEEFRH